MPRRPPISPFQKRRDEFLDRFQEFNPVPTDRGFTIGGVEIFYRYGEPKRSKRTPKNPLWQWNNPKRLCENEKDRRKYIVLEGGAGTRLKISRQVFYLRTSKLYESWSGNGSFSAPAKEENVHRARSALARVIWRGPTTDEKLREEFKKILAASKS